MDRPILFSGPMVRALLDGRKTQTRRVLNNNRFASLFNGGWADSYVLDPGNQSWRDSEVRYAVGDRLYVREAHYLTDDGDHDEVVYAVDAAAVVEHLATVAGLESSHPTSDWSRHRRLRPAMHMPRWASRLTLSVTDVRVQRLQEITNADAVAEGTPCYVCGGPLHGRSEDDCHCFHKKATATDYRYLWDTLNEGRGFGWETNPWVVAISFKVDRRNIDAEAA